MRRRLIPALFIALALISVSVVFYPKVSSRLKSSDVTSGANPAPYSPKPGSCLILEEKYCKPVKLVENPNKKGTFFGAFNVPKGAYLFAPVEGYYSKSVNFSFGDTRQSKSFSYPGTVIGVSMDGHVESMNALYSFVYFARKNNEYPLKIKKGEIMGIVSDKKIDAFGDFNLILTVAKRQTSKNKGIFENDLDGMKELLKVK